ncbi:MAG TPA: sugar-binding protein, partial [bacterium]
MKFKTWRLGVLAVEVVFVFVFPVFAFSQAPVSTPLTIDETTTPIRVDGHLEDWPATRMLLLNQASQAVLGRFLWKNPDSFSGRVFLTYDAAYLYVAVLVKRPAPAVNDNDKSALWNGDCLELFLSTDPAFQKQKRPTIGDYHIGFSPGTQCKNPRIYCFNKNKEIPGGRVIARKTNTGYLMEASVPLEFFGGLEVGKGKRIGFNVALDEGGSVGGNRVVQLDYSGHAESWETPSAWETLEWMGVAKASVPGGKEEDLYAKLVLDGTRNTTFLGFKTIAGMVADLNGKPLAGAKVGTWPKTKETVTGSDGRFVLDHVKTYDKTVVYGRTDGYASSLQPFLGSKALLTLNLQGLPFGGDSTLTQVSRLFYGQVFTVAQSQSQEGIKSLNLNLVKLTGLESTIKTPNAVYPELDKFMAFAKAVGAEPMVEVPLGQDPEEAARWVRYCNVEKNYHVRFWAIGNEPDRPAEKKDKTSVDDYGIYDYINDFRVFCNAMKRVDPSLFLVGPELASKYTSGKDDWITPFLRYDGDIVNLLSVHRYPDQCDSRGIQEAL